MNMSNDFLYINSLVSNFVKERDWDQFHTPKNLLIALVAEVGELSEVFLWRSDEDLRIYLESKDGREKITQEIADVAIYLIRMAQKLDINLLEVIKDKIEINQEKYPIEKSKGNSKKYTEFN
jgi:NTP pyrophosphatase (non-canonical NTP hydrolase)